MSDPIDAFPLTWPVGVPRSKCRNNGSFQQTISSAQEGLMRELRLMGAKNIVISSDVGPRKADGSLYARAKLNPPDPGVAVYFDRKGQPMCFACDKYFGVHNNLHAIAKTIEAIRGIERWGTAEMADAAFTGFAALPPPSAAPVKREWWDVLNVRPNSTTPEVEESYRNLAKRYGPDMPEEDHARFSEINVARDEWRGRA